LTARGSRGLRVDKPAGRAFVARMHFDTLALLDGLGGPELLVIAVVALLLFGSKRMPEIGRGIGRAIREFKRATSGVEENIREVLYDEPARPKLRPPPQRRPFQDASAHAPTAAAAATPAAPLTAAAPAAREPGLNEPAPLESPDSSKPVRDDTSSDPDMPTRV